MREAKSYCRLCFGFCGVKATIDEQDRVVTIRGDHDNPASLGYACIKGIEAPAMYNSPTRLLHPLKRVGDQFVRIGLEQALDEIAERMKAIIDAEGAQSLGFFRGTGTFASTVMIQSFPNLADAVGGQRFSTMTIDQSAKWVCQDRLGVWQAGKDVFDRSDVWLFAGANPLVSVFSWDTPVQNPMKRLKEARARGLKVVVIDPRECEIAKFADIHLQIYPGEDAATAAGLINVILSNGWEDKDFCAQHVQGLDQLRRAVAPFTPEVVAQRAGVTPEQLIAAADLFARQSRRGSVTTGTGPDMAANSNLAEHLYETLGVICGRFQKEGEPLANPGVIIGNRPRRAQVDGPKRAYETAPRSRVRGAVRLMGESASPTLPEEILTPGPGRIRGMFVAAANPLGAIPDPAKVAEAFRALDLLVVMDPRMTETARLADYVLPPKGIYEKADFTFALEWNNLDYPYVQYTPPIVPTPPGSELCDEGYVCWALAKRLGVTLAISGSAMDMETAPTDDDFLAMYAAGSAVPFEEIKAKALGGAVFDVPPRWVEAAGEDAGRFDVMPDDVAEELRAAFAAPSLAPEPASGYDLRLIARRIREVCNTSYRDFPTASARTPFNPLGVHPDDLARLGLADGQQVELVSEHGRIPAILERDPTLKPGVVSMTHGFGGMPGEPVDYRKAGANTGELISLDRDCEPLQAMPRMSGVPVRIERVADLTTA